MQQIQRESSEMLEEQGIPFCTDDQTVESHIKVSFLEWRRLLRQVAEA